MTEYQVSVSEGVGFRDRPEIYPDDYFLYIEDGEPPDPGRWEVINGDNGTVTVDEDLVDLLITVDEGYAGTVSARSTFKLTGDFDVQVIVRNGTASGGDGWWGIKAEAVADPAYYAAGGNEYNYVSGLWDHYRAEIASGGSPSTSRVTRYSGTVYWRIVRVGSEVTVYSSANGATWTSRRSRAYWTEGDVRIHLFFTADGNQDPDAYAHYDDFILANAAGMVGPPPTYWLSVAEGFGAADAVDGYDLSPAVSETAGFRAAVEGELPAEGENEEHSGFSDAVDVVAEYGETLPEGAGFAAVATCGFEIDATVAEGFGAADGVHGVKETAGVLSEGFGAADAIEAFNFSEWWRANRLRAVPRYYCTLTGAEDGLADATLPIASFQCRLRSGEPSYLSVVVPGAAYASNISARPSGQIVVDMAWRVDGVDYYREEIARADLETIRLDYGGNNRSITLTGHRTLTFGSEIATLLNPIYKTTSEGKVRYRFAVPDLYLRPGNTARVGADEFTVGLVTYTVGAGTASPMEVAEA